MPRDTDEVQAGIWYIDAEILQLQERRSKLEDELLEDAIEEEEDGQQESGR